MAAGDPHFRPLRYYVSLSATLGLVGIAIVGMVYNRVSDAMVAAVVSAVVAVVANHQAGKKNEAPA